MLKKAINSKAKATLLSCSSTKKIDQNSLRGNQLANSTILKSQNNTIKAPWVEKPKIRGLKLFSGFRRSNKLYKKARKKKMKKQHLKDQDCQKSSIPATGVNAAQTKKLYHKKKKNCLNKAHHNTGQFKYFNY